MPQSRIPSSALPTPVGTQGRKQRSRAGERLIAHRPVALQLPEMALPFATVSRSRCGSARVLRPIGREAEVAELIARGNTVAHIAELLFVSENTVRTHSKRIYVKLDIHKRQELIALVESFEPEGR